MADQNQGCSDREDLLGIDEEVMRQTHREAFFSVAADFHVWIGVREPNPLAERWIGQQHFHPKPDDCKAKTSNVQNHPLAGLVVSPDVCPGAFTDLTIAREKWGSFAVGRMLPPGYSLVKSGKNAGLVTLLASHTTKNKTGMDCAVYSDYDLMAIVDADENGARKPDRGLSPFSAPLKNDVRSRSTLAVRSGLRRDLATQYDEIIRKLNLKFGIPMVQHGPEFAWIAGVGGAVYEHVLWFGPKGDLNVGESSMPQKPYAH